MPVLIWDRDENGGISSRVVTTRRSAFAGEEFRAEADQLDEKIDQTLNLAVELVSRLADQRRDSKFASRWALGRALAVSNILGADELEVDERKFLWLALSRKCRLGIHATGETSDLWKKLIPQRNTDPIRPELDVFTLGLWLQEQDFPEAKITLSNSLANANEMFRRKALSSLKMRRVLYRWLCEARGLDSPLTTKEFETIAKRLCKRWPSRGIGSAKQPIHYENQEELYSEVVELLQDRCVRSPAIPSSL